MCAATKKDDDEIDKGLPALAIVCQGCLAFLGGRKQFSDVGNRLWGREATWFTLCDVFSLGLQEAAITSKNCTQLDVRTWEKRTRCASRIVSDEQ